MRLNIDCVRDILLCIERNTDYRKSVAFVDEISLKKLSPTSAIHQPDYNLVLLQKYDLDNILYHLKYCIKADILELNEQLSNCSVTVISDLTPKGHEFLANIRHKTIFEKTKIIANKIGIESLPAFVKISESTALEIIKSVILT